MPKTPLELIKERVEQGAAGSPVAGDRKLRELVYRRILDALDEAGRTTGSRKGASLGASPAEILGEVLEAVLEAMGERGRQEQARAREPLIARYSRELDRLKGQIQAIEFHPLISSFPSEEIGFKSIEELYCAHGHYRDVCAWIRRQLEALRADRTNAQARQALLALDIDPEKGRPEDFCPPWVRAWTPDEEAERKKAPPRPRGRGRPPDLFIGHFMESAAGLLQRKGLLNQEQGFGLAAELVGACLGPEVSAEYRMRQSRRRRRETSKPKTRGRASPKRRGQK